MTKKAAAPPPPDGKTVLARVLAGTQADIAAAVAKRQAENEKLVARGKKVKGEVDEQLSFSIYFGRQFGQAIANGLNPAFDNKVISGETPSASAEGEKRVDVSYSTPQRGLGLMVSLKSVHRGERENGTARFTHNMKRNDEELRVEATSLHLRQPYAVLAAVVVLPFAACHDSWRTPGQDKPKSSFARWVEKLWTLKGRAEPEDPPDRFESVFFALYDQDSTELGFYEVGGAAPCPREQRPQVLSFAQFLEQIKGAYYRRNERDFHFEGEEPSPELGDSTYDKGEAIAEDAEE